MTAPGKAWLGRLLDILLFVATLFAVGLGFWEKAPEWSVLAALGCFMVLFFWRWQISLDRKAYLKDNWLDLALIVLLASPLLRLLMALRVVGLVPALRLGALIRSNRKHIMKLIVLSQDSFPAAMTMVFAIVFLFGSSAYLLEHATNPGFSEVGDGLWWAFVTLTTVGYGDIVPMTTGGRIVGVLTMIFGIAVYSLMIANLTFFVEEQGRKRQQEQAEALEQDIEEKDR